MKNFLVLVFTLVSAMTYAEVSSCISKESKTYPVDYRCKFDDGSSAGNLTINGIDSYRMDADRKKELCRPISSASRVVVLKCAKSDTDQRTSSVVVIDRETGETQYASSGITGNTHAVFSGIKCTGVETGGKGEAAPSAPK